MSASLVVLAATQQWTYWFAPSFLAAGIVLVVGLAMTYYRKLMVPHYRWTVLEQQRAVTNSIAASAGRVRHLTAEADDMSLRAA